MIVVQSWGPNNAAGDALPPIGNEAITWNTHKKIRQHFGFPEDSEFFSIWLDWFYQLLNQDQRRTLRYDDLSTIDMSDFPTPPTP